MALKAKQRLLAELMIMNPDLTNLEYAQEIGIDPTTLYRWKRDQEFKDYLSELLREQWKGAEKIAQKKMIELAKSGDFRANQYILNSLGYEPVRKVEADISNEINIIIEE